MRAIARLACASAVALLSTQADPTAQKGAPLPPSEPLVAWRVAGEGRGRPAVDGSAVFFLSMRHEVFAFDAASGARLWSQTTGEPGEATAGSTLVLAGPVVVAGDYNLAAFERSTGALRWRFVPWAWSGALS